MHKEFLMGNEAIALGAIAAGVNLVSGYPGTPSTEVLETIAKRRANQIYVEWSVNEKVALEVAAGAAYTGARTLVTMKQVGLNVASDPLMSLEYIGVKGGMVILVADDPGPISSQTEQDTRSFAGFSKIPCFDPSSAQEAYEMIQEAYVFSEKYHTPVFLRPTTRVCHGYASIDVKDAEEYLVNSPEGFVKDPSFVIFPKLSFQAHKRIEERNQILTDIFSKYEKNIIHEAKGAFTDAKIGIATGGISYTYVMEALKQFGMLRTLKVSTPYPFPEKLALSFLDGLDAVLCVEELDPVIEQALVNVCGKYHLSTKIYGKTTGNVQIAGENSRDCVCESIQEFAKANDYILATDTCNACEADKEQAPTLPVRPPVLCAGCPHRASFYAVKQAMKGKKTIFCGDIGCYTLGNAMPLDMVDTCLCMGAGLGIAQGVGHIEPDTHCFAFVGDSTFFASAITGVVNAIYNQARMTLIILDNSTTAMTGHQPHPGTGLTMMGEIVNKVNIEQVLRGIGVTSVRTVNPLDLQEAIEAVKAASEEPFVKAIIFKSPCIAIEKQHGCMFLDDTKCIGCEKCIRELGCPAISKDTQGIHIDASMCTGCGLCSKVCPVNAIGGENHA
ncbi:MAG: indolepyruvate ferredoxin oxidoreductase subunit alpha [Eubacteriales bacterium]|nr:indolepyruvate ferredoxin oxidoreductase subunit alpha [Lachnospiraceae bacterium]MDO5126857.1 indolepyruvate ferredoxin oxidoreductase subunit alpha [Eubacteriales bacterium]